MSTNESDHRRAGSRVPLRDADADLVAVRELAERVAQLPAHRPGRQLWGRPVWPTGLLVPSAVALAVVAVLVGAVAVFAPGGLPGGGVRLDRPDGGGRAVAPGSASPRSLTVGEPASVVAAWPQLIGPAGAHGPWHYDPGEVIYTCTDEVTVQGPRRLHEVWLDPQGMIPLSVSTDGVVTERPAKGRDELRNRFAQQGPNLQQPSPEWLAQLPTDPTALLAFLRAQAATADPNPTVDHRVWELVVSMLSKADGLLTPDVRTALYGALSRIDGVTAYSLSLGGRSLFAMRHGADDGSVTGLLFDRHTGRAVGRDSGQVGEGSVLALDYQALWCWALVAFAR